MNNISNNTNETEVLIVGAGPSGLMMACQLALNGIKPRIIDKQERQTNYSGALLIQARTLEIWNQMEIASEAVNLGQIAKNVSLIHYGKLSARINIEKMGLGESKYPYILMLKQYHTEKLLIQYLKKQGIRVERNITLKQIYEKGANVEAILCNADGDEEINLCKYLVGADGVYSKVRNILEIPWFGKTNPDPLVVTDCIVEQIERTKNIESYSFNNKMDDIIFAISKESIAGLFPLGNNAWRIDSVIPHSLRNNTSISFTNIANGFSDRVNMSIGLKNPDWFSVFQTNTYLAETFSRKRCFLIGDAAHVHTPIGAQGMNTGMQDAYNLAWKMAHTIRYKASSELLQTYSSERRVIAKHLIRSTDRYFDISVNNSFYARVLRINILPNLIKYLQGVLKRKSIQKRFFREISEIGIHYRNSWLSINKDTISYKNLNPGERWPYIQWLDESGNNKNIQDSLNGIQFVLFYFNRNNKNKGDIPEELQGLTKNYGQTLKQVIIPYSSHSKGVYDKLKVKNIKYFLIRPDGYVSLSSKETGFNSVRIYFQRLYGVEH